MGEGGKEEEGGLRRMGIEGKSNKSGTLWHLLSPIKGGTLGGAGRTRRGVKQGASFGSENCPHTFSQAAGV